jgi:FixJ family two-component response regulator
MTPARGLVSIVDDDESVRESLPDFLRSFGHQVLPFASADEFLQREAHLERTGCLILDVAMPGMSGPELQLELSRRSCSIPIVFITGLCAGAVRQQVMARGAITCLPKPFSESALLDAVTTALERH